MIEIDKPANSLLQVMTIQFNLATACCKINIIRKAI